MSEINVIPYIDVTLVLLIIFMIASPLVQTGVDVNLPKVKTSPIATNNNPPIIVSINKQGDFFVDLGTQESIHVNTEALLYQVKEAIRNKPLTQIYIKGDGAVEYEKIVEAMVALNNAGVIKVGLITSSID